MNRYECIGKYHGCRLGVRPSKPGDPDHDDNAPIRPVWVHEDGFRECMPHYASPNFDKPL